MNTQNTQECKATHTPTPWEFAYGSIYKSGDGREINDENAIRIALMDRNEEATKPTERDANAQFIVRACNAHEELLSACKMTLAIFKEYEEAHECINYVDAERIMRKCQSAIQKAEVQS